ncbi:tryptophan 7-halogenase [Kordiimonas sp.]|uniref:tryptophan 7-halogenase n=1 Tax=Kordiimonas sp. TaxID=1970157 RepID=UPI003A9114AA
MANVGYSQSQKLTGTAVPEQDDHNRKTIAIIGGGPAASATALSFLRALKPPDDRPSAPSVSVKIFCEPPPNAIRVGESIPPAATPALRALGLGDLLNNPVDKNNLHGPHRPCPGSTSLWSSKEPGYNDFMFEVMGHGYHLDRACFDSQMLREAIIAGASVYQGWRLVGAREYPEGALLEFSVPEKKRHTIKADFVVDASGLPAAYARRIGVMRNTLDDVVFLCAIVDMPAGEAMSERTLVESVEDGWWYAARLPDNKAIITYCTDAALVKEQNLRDPARWRQAFRNTVWLHHQIPASAVPDSISIIPRAAPSSLLSAVYGESWLAVGDAASSYDPISSAGITKALMHGHDAGTAIAHKLIFGHTEKLQAYGRRVFHDFEQFARVRAQLYGSESRFAGKPFWRRRLGLADNLP